MTVPSHFSPTSSNLHQKLLNSQEINNDAQNVLQKPLSLFINSSLPSFFDSNTSVAQNIPNFQSQISNNLYNIHPPRNGINTTNNDQEDAKSEKQHEFESQQLPELELSDSHVSDPQLHDSKVINSQPSNSQLSDLQPSNSQISRPPSNDQIYLDFQATTPLDPRVLDAMLPYLTTHFGNPHSRSHSFGWTSENGLNVAREQISTLLNCDKNEIIFTSGATESNNLAIKGLADFYLSQNIKPHFITAVTEHKCVLNSFLDLESKGVEVTYLPVDTNGYLNLDTLRKSFKDNTKLVSIMTVNNEIGVVQDIDQIGEICAKKGIAFHTDAAQAVGKLDIDVRKSKVSMLSGSGHKIYGPKGIGFLYINKRSKDCVRPRIKSIIKGGDQEFGLRAGTIPTHLCVGLGKACEIAKKEMKRDYNIVKRLSDRLTNYLKKNLKDIKFNSYTGVLHSIKDSYSGMNSKESLQKPKNGSQDFISSPESSPRSSRTDSKKELFIPDSSLESSSKDSTKESTQKDLLLNQYPGCVNISFSYVEGESLLMKLKDIALSSGSACTSGSLEPSYILRALKVDDDLAHSSIRFGISKFTSESDIDRVKKMVVKKVNELRDLSPLYEMVKEGIDLKQIQWSQE